MLWRRRSSSVCSDSTVGVNNIAQLNARFRLRIPKHSASKVIIKEAFLHTDDSTCSTRSSRSQLSSSTATAGKHVHFSDQNVVFLPSMNFPTEAEAAAIWFTSTEITNMKNELRDIWKGSHIYDQDFVIAVDLVQNLFIGQVIPPEHLEERDEILDSQVKRIEVYKECARILARNEGRGLERMQYGKGTFSKVGAKSLHVQRFIRSVLDVQKQMKNCEIDSRSAAIAAQCQSLPSIWWARILAEVDAETSRSDLLPPRTNISQHQLSSVAFEV
jgi:hypothetical protein